MTFQQAGDPHHIPSTTLRRAHAKSQLAILRSTRYSNPDVVVESAIFATLGKHTRMLTDDVQNKLIDYIELCEDMCHPIDFDVVKLKSKRLYFA